MKAFQSFIFMTFFTNNLSISSVPMEYSQSNKFTLLGSCYCRFGIIGRHCDQITSGMYIPSFNHYILEAEQGEGSFERTSEVNGYNQRFSGYGYALVNASGSVELRFTPDMTRP